LVPTDHEAPSRLLLLFRLFVDEGTVIAASLYCFYDGEDDSPRVDSRSAAEALAALNGFAPP